MQLQPLYFLIIGALLRIVSNGESPVQLQWNKMTKGTTLPNFDVLSYYFDTEDHNTVARLLVEIPANQKTNTSLLFSYQTRDLSSGSQVPNVIYNVSHYIIAKTLCPFTRRENLTVQLRSYEPVKFNFTAWKIDYFYLHTNVSLKNRVFIVQPQFFEYTFERNIDHVTVDVTSESHDCMIVSIQEKRCPVFDENNNVLSTGSYLTMTTSASFPVSVNLPKFSSHYCSQRRDFKGDSFYVVLVKSKDDDCSSAEFIKQVNSDPSAGKTFRITVKDAGYNIAGPMLFLTLLYAAVTAVLIGYILFEQEIEKREWRTFLETNAEDELAVQLEENLNDSVQVSISSFDQLSDTDEPAAVRRKNELKVSDLCMIPWASRNDKFTKYYISLITVALFYALPVVQLVLDHVENVHTIGNLDLCWFNFRCAKPVTIGSLYLFAFNSILSNAGYVLLGILYLIMTKERDRRYQAWVQLSPNVKEIYGLPQHPGISYAIGVAVIMEGLMSMCYHVCPTAENFQFDTAFMFICAVLGMMKIYQLRHPDIVVKAHKTFFTMAFVIFFISVGKFNITHDHFNPFWLFYAICYPILMVVISAEFYFKGRFCFLLFANLTNLLFVAFGLMVQPKDFASFLLFPLIMNILLYLMYYIVMKFANGERLSLSVLLLLALSSALWAVALWYFNHNVSDWAVLPAESRVLNKNCAVFGYFDNHDVWHLCSSLAIFISFTLIDRLDDDLRFTKRCEIPVF